MKNYKTKNKNKTKNIDPKYLPVISQFDNTIAPGIGSIDSISIAITKGESRFGGGCVGLRFPDSFCTFNRFLFGGWLGSIEVTERRDVVGVEGGEEGVTGDGAEEVEVKGEGEDVGGIVLLFWLFIDFLNAAVTFSSATWVQPPGLAPQSTTTKPSLLVELLLLLLFFFSLKKWNLSSSWMSL